MISPQFTNNPLTAHPLADQSEWWATDQSTHAVETIHNRKVFSPDFVTPIIPSRVQEAGLDVPRKNGSLTIRAWKE